MQSHLISRIEVTKLWGDKTIAFDLFDDVNVIIGPNASGKTTIINILMFVLTGNIPRLLDYSFEQIRIHLRSFDDKKSTKIVTVARDGNEVRISVGKKSFVSPDFSKLKRSRSSSLAELPPEFLRRHFGSELFEFKKLLDGLVPAAWLPVSRRLPMNDDDDSERLRPKRGSLESVDECLSELLDGLQRYRVSLDTKLSELRKDFQKHALENILYDKRHDRMLDMQEFHPPTDDDKAQLIKAFHDVGFVDKAMESRIEEHFKAAANAIDEIAKSERQYKIDTIFIVPLIHRTKQMIEFAQDLESKRQELFAPLDLYIATVKLFIKEKNIAISPRGELDLQRAGSGRIEWKHLSSGEKQLLILLTQALLWEKDPVVYVADEPELSLHVTWQEQLLKSVTSLAGRCQVIVATHSPDIAGGFQDRIINLALV